MFQRPRVPYRGRLGLYAEDFRALVVAVSVEMPENENLPVRLRERADRRAEKTVTLVTVHPRKR